MVERKENIEEERRRGDSRRGEKEEEIVGEERWRIR